MTNKNYVGNGTTIGKFILIPIATWLLTLLASKGLNLGIDAQTLAEILGVIIGFAYAYLDAKYPHTMKTFGNKCSCNLETNALNGMMDDVDPASEYEEPKNAGEEDEP